MELYLVNFELESGHRLSLLTAAPDVHAAIKQANQIIRETAEPRNDGDCMRYCFDSAEVTAEHVTQFVASSLTFDHQGNLV